MSGKRRIFVDTRATRDFAGDVQWRWHTARKHPQPVLRGAPERPWEAQGMEWGTVLPIGGRLRWWYNALPQVVPADSATDLGEGPGTAYVAYAESADGIHWERPELGILDYQGSRANNLTELMGNEPSVIYEPDDPDPARRYKAIALLDTVSPSMKPPPALRDRYRPPAGEPRGYYAQFSPDGLHWELGPMLFPGALANGLTPGDPMIDALRATGYGRPGMVRVGPGDFGICIRDEPRHRYLFLSKRGYRYGLNHRRSLAVAASTDFLNWEPARMALVPDEQDDRRAQEQGFHHCEFYGMGVMPFDDFLLGLLWVGYWWPPYHVNWGNYGVVGEIQPVYSFDGYFWQRPPGRRPLLSVGEPGGWDGGNLYTVFRGVEFQDDVLVFFCCTSYPHMAEPLPIEYVMGMAKLKRDRLASFWCAGEGSFVVYHGKRDGDRLLVNARTLRGADRPGGRWVTYEGWVKAQVLWADGTAIEGYGIEQCHPFTGDSLSGEITWGGKSLADLPPDREVAIRFVLCAADLFAYQLSP